MDEEHMKQGRQVVVNFIFQGFLILHMPLEAEVSLFLFFWYYHFEKQLNLCFFALDR